MSQQVVAGLAGIKAFKAKKEAEREARERPRANYFNWKNNKSKDDKNVLFVTFLQEFESHIEGYDERFGLPVMAVEHQAPGKEGYKRRANCTMESEGQCYACERHSEDYKIGWGQKNNFYTWVLVDYNDGEGPQPVVLSRSLGSTFVDDLVIEVESDDENRITNKMWKITKTGSGKSTAWKLREAKGMEPYDNTDVELPASLEQAVLRPIPYDEQAAYYGAVYKAGDPLDGDEDETPSAAKETPQKQPTGELEW